MLTPAPKEDGRSAVQTDGNKRQVGEDGPSISTETMEVLRRLRASSTDPRRDTDIARARSLLTQHLDDSFGARLDIAIRAHALQSTYGNGQNGRIAHPRYSHNDWTFALQCHATQLGYWDWCAEREIAAEQSATDISNYTHVGIADLKVGDRILAPEHRTADKPGGNSRTTGIETAIIDMITPTPDGVVLRLIDDRRKIDIPTGEQIQRSTGKVEPLHLTISTAVLVGSVDELRRSTGATKDAEIGDMVITALLDPPARRALPIIEIDTTEMENNRIAVELTALIVDPTATIDQAEEQRQRKWGDGEPVVSLTDAVHELLIGSNDQPAPLEFGLEI